MNYLEIKEKLEAARLELIKKMQDPSILDKEKDKLQYTIENYEYMIELTDMNHFERGDIQ